jgi:hypothetical protein
MPEQQLLATIKADFSKGVTIVDSSKPAADGRERLRIRGALWEITVVQNLGRNAGTPICSLQGVAKLKHPNNEQLIKPVSVEFNPIWDECPCNGTDIKVKYRAIKREIESTEHQLRNPSSDVSVRKHAQDHGKARKQYSALRVMMNLLRLKSEQGKHEFDALVLPSVPDSLLQEGSVDGSDNNVLLNIRGIIPSDVLDSGVSVEISQGEGQRALRTSIIAVHGQSGGLVIELDIQFDRVLESERVTLSTISRFGMWAHERAVSDFLNESVHGYWQNLARLLCSPKEITPPNASAAVSKFFCDEVPGLPKLNEKQRQAVVGAVNAPSAFCIQGPPGTGKTTVICEIVQHLIARGERVLMVAPTHVAIDEVLRRIGTRPHIHAIRLSWNDSRVAEDVRQYIPSSLANPLFDAISKSSRDKVNDWNTERQQLVDRVALLTRYTEALRREQYSDHQSANDTRELEWFRQKYAAIQPDLVGKLETVQVERASRRVTRDRIAADAEESNAELATIRAEAGFGTSLLGAVGLGSLGAAKRRQSRLVKAIKAIDDEISEFNTEENGLTKELDDLAEKLVAKTKTAADSQQDYSNCKTQRTAVEADCQSSSALVGIDLDPDTAGSLNKRFAEREKRLSIYPELSNTLHTLITSEDGVSINWESLQKDLVSSANLFCCTTTGVAGSRELRDLSFDTLIVDESSRVTDSEFLIGAVRAKRWLLVGDEYQLPPYVEQEDEHFIHALSAIHRSEQGDIPLEEAVNELGELWQEDEELHKFRSKSVLTFATELKDSGLWEDVYDTAYSSGIRKLKSQVNNPTKALLDAMRESIVHSLFERVVGVCPDRVKVRLAEQRRMIEPIARIVSQPVYAGDYQSPSEAELARSGVIPLTTATFQTPITFLDTSALGIRGRDELIRNSFVNKAEAKLIVKACLILEREITNISTDSVTVSILAFYKAQARLIDRELRKHRFQRLRFAVIDAIDRIQGQESDVVFLSFTRTRGNHVSSHFGQWLQDIRRLNVACTRAHRALFLVGQKDMLIRLHSNEQAVAFYKNLDSLFEAHPEHMTIIKYLGDD